MCSGCKGEIKVQPYKEIEVSPHASHAGVWQVYLKREAVRNAFNDALIAELTQAFKAIAADDAARDEPGRATAHGALLPRPPLCASNLP